MAASKLTDEEIVDKIDEGFLTCHICFEKFNTNQQIPKILPCHHDFCQLCLENLVKKTGRLDCPTCKRSVQLPRAGVAGLDNNFFKNSLLAIVMKRTGGVADQSERSCEFCEGEEASVYCVDCQQYYCKKCVLQIHKKLKLASTKPHELVKAIQENKTEIRKRASMLTSKGNCNVHPKNKVKYYCDTLRIPICSECTATDTHIPDHSHRCLQEVADECNKELSVLIEKLKVKAREVDQSRVVVKGVCKKVTEQCMVNKSNVKKHKNALIDKIEKEQNELMDILDDDCSLQVKGLECDISDLELKYEYLISTCSYTESLMCHGNACQLVSKQQSVKARLENLVAMDTKPKDYDVADFLPSDDIITHNGILGLVRSDVRISQCTVDNIPKQLLKGESVNLLITTKIKSQKPMIPNQAVEVTLTKSDGSKTELDVTDYRDGTHKVTVNTDMDGKYQVAVTVGDQEVPGSPFEIPVIKGLVKTLGKEGNKKGQLYRPRNLTVNKNGNVVVTDTGNNRVQIISMKGKCKKTFTFKQFGKRFFPCDVAVSADDKYFMTDWNNKQVVVSDEDGKVITTFGQELKQPLGISISPLDGAVYVSDWDGRSTDISDKEGNCIRKYTQDGQYIKSIGKYGEQNGEFRGPCIMAHDKQGMLYVSDTQNCRIQVFNTDDQFLYKFHHESPLGLSVDSNRYVYVSNYHGNIEKLDSSGRLISRVNSDEDGLDIATGVGVIDSVPVKVVALDANNHCVRVYVP